jgi:hypothetical protein
MSGDRSTSAMPTDHIPSAHAIGMSFSSTIGLSVCLKSSYLRRAEGTKGRNLLLEVRRIRSGTYRDRQGNVGWLDFRAPYRHLVVDATVTSARTNTSVFQIDTRLPLPGSLALGVQQGKLDADLRTSALLGTPSV